MSVHNAEVRQFVAAEQGLDAEAAEFLAGSTVSELEANAAALAKLLGTAAAQEPEPAPRPPDPFSGAAERKAARQRDLVRSLHGGQQQRDEHGRFVSPSRASGAGFDGGARGGLPLRRSPEQEHNELVAQMASVSRTYRFGSGF